MNHLQKLIVAFGFLSVSAVGQIAAAEQHDYSGHGKTDALAPSAPGQDAFAAISEIVEILRTDPNTDWSKVDIDALRRHLQDMNALTLHATVKAETRPGSIAFLVTGTGRTYEAIARMVRAHANELNNMPNLAVAAKETEGGIMLSIKSDDTGLLEQISAIGFFGTITFGAHHPDHHLAIARGELHDH